MHKLLMLSLAAAFLTLLAVYGITTAYQHIGDIAGQAVAVEEGH
jgi:hypothetical protein